MFAVCCTDARRESAPTEATNGGDRSAWAEDNGLVQRCELRKQLAALFNRANRHVVTDLGERPPHILDRRIRVGGINGIARGSFEHFDDRPVGRHHLDGLTLGDQAFGP